MSEKTLTFSNIRLNKKGFHKSKEPIELMSVIADQIVVCDKFKHNNEAFKYFIGYKEGEVVKQLCIILPQTSGYIKYFENRSKKKQTSRFTKLKSDSDSDSSDLDSEKMRAKVDNKLMGKLESASDSE